MKIWFMSPALTETAVTVSADEHAQLDRAVDELATLFNREFPPEQQEDYAELNRQASGQQTAHEPKLQPGVADSNEKSNRQIRGGGASDRQAPPTTEPGFITLKAACKWTALSKGYLSKLCSNGVIVTNGIKGKGMRMSAASVAEFMLSRDE
jgi:hypothetical protein